jgi:hypothetical protein
MSKITTLATGQVTATDAVTIELVEADETPAVVIITWPHGQRVAPSALPRGR